MRALPTAGVSFFLSAAKSLSEKSSQAKRSPAEGSERPFSVFRLVIPGGFFARFLPRKARGSTSACEGRAPLSCFCPEKRRGPLSVVSYPVRDSRPLFARFSFLGLQSSAGLFLPVSRFVKSRRTFYPLSAVKSPAVPLPGSRKAALFYRFLLFEGQSAPFSAVFRPSEGPRGPFCQEIGPLNVNRM